MVVAERLVLVMNVLESNETPAVVEVLTVRFPFKLIAVAVNEIASVAVIPAMLLTVPTVKAALFWTVSEVIPEAAIVLSVLDVLLKE